MSGLYALFLPIRGMNTHSQDWSQYWDGRDQSDSNEALTGVESHPQIAEFWTQALKPLDRNSPLLDLACGAGSVVRRADSLGFENLTGSDISEAALNRLSKGLPHVRIAQSSADDTPFENESFAVITSQYGIEYAGILNCVAEITRLLSPGGQFIALTHISDGAIAQECDGKADLMRELVESQFFESAKAVFATAYAKDQQHYNKAVEALKVPQNTVANLANAGVGLAGHILNGMQHMFSRLQNYALEDVVAWIDGNEAEAKGYLGRMESMLAAALDEGDVKSLRLSFEEQGLDVMPAEIFSVVRDEQSERIGWIIRAVKPVS